MDTNGLQKVMDLSLSAAKTAANLSEMAKRDKAQKQQQDNGPKKESTNQPHNQTVEVKVGELGQGGNTAPKIIREKTEQHIHKHFPENREMSKDECDLERYRLELDYKDREAERNFRLLMEQNRRNDQKERDEYAHKLDAERKAEIQKTRKRNRIIGGILVGCGLGIAGYCLYSDFRNNQCSGLAIPAPKPPKKMTPLKGEGSVK